MGVNLITCDNLLDAFIAMVVNLDDAERGIICQYLKCSPDLKDMVAAVEPNMLSVTEDGEFLVLPASAVSEDAGNALAIGKDNKLYVRVPEVTAGGLISKEAGNIIRVGKDGMLYASVAQVSPASLLSEDNGNTLQIGKDGGLFYPDQVVVTTEDPGNGADIGDAKVVIVVKP